MSGQVPPPTPPRELAPGLFHWTAFHPDQKVVVSSYHAEEAGVLVDPMLPAGGADAFAGRRPPEAIVVTNRYHSRDGAALARDLGCRVLCHAAGLEHVRQRAPTAEPFEHGEELPGGIEALAAPGFTPDESVLLVPAAGGALTFADILIAEGGALGWAPDGWYGDDPAAAKARVAEACRGLLDREFRHLLTTHGGPIIDRGREALEAFLRNA